MTLLSRARTKWFTGIVQARRDLLAGLVVCLALIPEAIGFALISGVNPSVTALHDKAGVEAGIAPHRTDARHRLFADLNASPPSCRT